MALLCVTCARAITDDDLPSDPSVRIRCPNPKCRGEQLVALPDPATPPTVPWKVTTNDRRFLKSLRIHGESIGESQ